MSSYSYSVEADGDATFRVRPAKRPFFGFWLGIGLACAMAVFGVLFGLWSLSDYRSAALGAFIGGAALLYGLVIAYQIFWSRSAKYRTPVSFVVSPYSFTMNGQEVSLDRVNGFEIRNAMDGSFQLATGAIFAGSGAIGTAAAGALAAAHSGALAIDAARFRALAQRSFYIVIQFGGEEATVAGGLTAVTATGLVADIHRAIREELR